MSNTEPPSRGSECRSCKAVLHPGARFCHHCGTPAGSRAGYRQWHWTAVVVVLVAAAAVGVGLIFTVGQFAGEQRQAERAPQAGTAGPTAATGQPPDLSKMSPREAADRLFNRVMAADERGDAAEVTRFAPMALQAYGMVDRLDADARYHVGLIHLLSGDLDETARQIESLERQVPNHLLALILSIKVAEKRGDAKGVSNARARFRAAYAREIRGLRREYQAHRRTIEKYHATAFAE